MTPRLVNRRIRLLFVLLALALAGSLARAVWLQGVRAQPLSKLAATQQRQTVELPARRGTIFDRNGVPLALGEQATTVYADASQVRNPRAVAVAAERALGVDAEKLYPALTDPSRLFVYLRRKADPEDADELRRKRFAGVGFYAEERRSYPQGTVAAQVLGFAGADNEGLAGLELSLDRALRGTPGRETVIRDPFGRVVDVLSETAERPGRDVFLTLDHRLQATCRGRAPAHGSPLARAGGDGGRARPALGRDPRDGDRAELRREQLREDAAGLPPQPHRQRHVRARLDLQADPGRRRALGRARHAGDRRSRSRRRSASPTARSTSTTRGRRCGCRSPRSSRSRRTSARSRSRARSARSGWRRGSTVSGSGA